SYETTFAELTLSQMIWDGFATRSEVERLDRAKLVRYYELLGASENVALEASRAYLDVSRYRELVRLAQDPADLQGWVLLGRTLTFLDEFEAAGRAFGEALRHGGDRDPEVLVRYADVLAELEGGLAGEPAALIEQALAIDPENAQGLWLAGTRAYQAGAHEEARAYWERLLAVLPEGTAEAEVIRGNLMQLQQP
ncbi:TPR domain-containing protein, partial [Taklimakanibacter deserti]|uniref:tetratricopeptide repeat protein n=1 Tax=Taklimakanibacter deserti TaxID=2267839 RepID=UPI003F684ABE